MEDQDPEHGAAPRVSVVMPVFNGRRYVREAIRSILEQTFTDFEFIIVDDGSTDSTGTILERWAARDSRIRVLSEPHRGLVRTLNTGLLAARGEYIARQDADDRSMPERLEQQVQFLDRAPRIAMVGTMLWVIDEEGDRKYPVSLPSAYEDLLPRLEAHNAMQHGSLMFRQAILDEVGLFRPEFITSEDYDFVLRVAERFPVMNLPDALYEYRKDIESITSTNTELVRLYGELAVECYWQRDVFGRDMFTLDEPISPEGWSLSPHYRPEFDLVR